MNSIRFGYFDHIDNHGVSRNGILSFPLVGNKRIGVDPKFVFGTDLKEYGVDVPIYTKKAIIVPNLVISNEFSDRVGFGIQCVWKLK